jgi:phage terminase small subunit
MTVTEISPKQERFCEEYLLDLNGTQAAVRAGYGEKGAKVRACELLAKPEIQERVAELKAEREKRVRIDRDYVLTRLQTVAERCMQQEAPVTRSGAPILVETPSGQLAAAYAFDATGATRALDLLGRHIGLFEKDNKQRGSAGLTTEELIKMLDEREPAAREERIARIDAEIEESLGKNGGQTQH